MEARWRGWCVFACASLTSVLATAALGAAAHAAPPLAGVPVQLPAPNACYSSTIAGGCSAFGESLSISGAEAIAISNDGSNIYAAGDNGGGAAFSRGPGGALSAIGTAGGFADTSFAANGAGLFVAMRDSGINNGGVQAFARGAGGSLSPANEVLDSCPTGTAHCASNNGLYDVEGIAVAPDGAHLYAASHSGGGAAGGALTAFSRNGATQAITQLQCVPQTSTASGLCHEGGGFASLEGADSVAVSPDGKFLYATGYFANSVAGFNIVQSGPGVGKIGSLVNCLWFSATSECQQATGMNSPKGIALSPDGRDVYVAMFNGGITALRRDPVSGVLSFNQCYTKSGGSGCAMDSTLVVGARDVVVSPDGSHVYLSGGSGVNGYVRAYVRDSLTGMLTAIGCVSYLAIPGCTTAAGLANADKLAVSPDGRDLYVTAFEGGDGNGAVAAFRIQGAPSCQGTSFGVVAGSTATIPLACVDESGDSITRRIVSAPGKGTLGEINQGAGTVTYTPAPGFAGTDSLVFAASDGTNESAPATISLSVTAPSATAPPNVANVSQSHGRWRESNKLATFARKKKPPVGTTFSFVLNDPATMSFSFTQHVGGRRVGHKCVGKTRINRKRRSCKRTVTPGTLSFTGHAGTNRVAFQGRISHSEKLKPGRYTLVIEATNSAGRSVPARLTFTIVK